MARDAEEPLLGGSDAEDIAGISEREDSPGGGPLGRSRSWLSEQLRGGGSGSRSSTGALAAAVSQAGLHDSGHAALHESPTEHGNALLRLPPGYHPSGMGGRPGVSRMTSARHRDAHSSRARRSAWIVIDDHAKRSFLHADKRSLIIQLGINIPIRDMRLLDFNLLSSETGKMLVRDNAIILSIEHVRLIVTADKVLIPREGYEHNPLSNRFVDVLEESIAEWARQQAMHTQPLSIDPRLAAAGMHPGLGAAVAAVSTPTGGQHSDYEDDHSSAAHHDHQQLPFELVALEAALKEVVNQAGLQVKELEAVALPALDALTKSVSTGNLERVRKVKTRHQRLTIRCETLRDELERFLHDDDDMVKMCLTRRKELEEQYRAAERAAAAAALQPDGEGGHRAAATPMPSVVGSHRTRVLLGVPSLSRSAAVAAVAAMQQGSPTAGMRESGTPMLPPGALEEELTEEAAEDVENLLESYFAQVDAQYDKLRNIGEYIEDTEEYINIELDAGRNRLIRLDIVLTAASFAIAPFNLLAGIMGENLVIPPFLTTSVSRFYALNAVALLLCCCFFSSIIFYMRWRKLI